MKAVFTRVKSTSVTVGGSAVGHAKGGGTDTILAFVGVGRVDAVDAWETMARKIAELHILDDELNTVDANAPMLVVNQFTLMGATKRGRRPSWIDAAPGPEAELVIEKIVENLRNRGLTVVTGQLGAMMEAVSVDDDPFTVLVKC